MSKRGWATGCGIGCGLVLLVTACIGYYAWGVVSRTVEGIGQIETASKKVSERFGEVNEYTPASDGHIPAERLDAFLRVRELMEPTRKEVEASLALMSEGFGSGAEPPGIVGSFWQWVVGIGATGAASQIVPQVMSLISARAEAQLEAGIGSGEYLYIYCMSYFAYLGRSPADGPAFGLVGDSGQQGGQRPADEFDVREARREYLQRRLNGMLRGMLRRQLEALAGSPRRAKLRDWEQALRAELEAMEASRYRLAWREELPEPLESSLRPYRVRLADSYSALCGPIELETAHGE